jgi:hypothetical protein
LRAMTTSIGFVFRSEAFVSCGGKARRSGEG